MRAAPPVADPGHDRASLPTRCRAVGFAVARHRIAGVARGFPVLGTASPVPPAAAGLGDRPRRRPTAARLIGLPVALVAVAVVPVGGAIPPLGSSTSAYAAAEPAPDADRNGRAAVAPHSGTESRRASADAGEIDPLAPLPKAR